MVHNRAFRALLALALSCYISVAASQSCNCNGHSTQCDPVFATACLNCQHNTVGKQCEECAEGFFGDATVGTPDDCQPCNCFGPGSASVQCDSTGACTCLEEFQGEKCDRCAPGRHGFPSCQQECDGCYVAVGNEYTQDVEPVFQQHGQAIESAPLDEAAASPSFQDRLSSIQRTIANTNNINAAADDTFSQLYQRMSQTNAALLALRDNTIKSANDTLHRARRLNEQALEALAQIRPATKERQDSLASAIGNLAQASQNANTGNQILQQAEAAASAAQALERAASDQQSQLSQDLSSIHEARQCSDEFATQSKQDALQAFATASTQAPRTPGLVDKAVNLKSSGNIASAAFSDTAVQLDSEKQRTATTKALLDDLDMPLTAHEVSNSIASTDSQLSQMDQSLPDDLSTQVSERLQRLQSASLSLNNVIQNQLSMAQAGLNEIQTATSVADAAVRKAEDIVKEADTVEKVAQQVVNARNDAVDDLEEITAANNLIAQAQLELSKAMTAVDDIILLTNAASDQNLGVFSVSVAISSLLGSLQSRIAEAEAVRDDITSTLSIIEQKHQAEESSSQAASPLRNDMLVVERDTQDVVDTTLERATEQKQRWCAASESAASLLATTSAVLDDITSLKAQVDVLETRSGELDQANLVIQTLQNQLATVLQQQQTEFVTQVNRAQSLTDELNRLREIASFIPNECFD